ncbi:MAG: chromate transporter [Mycoplasmataceae bacterium]|nr:chromate transporter [Mycoplasmataceae bacterium]MBR3832263.1 chromate transporter [Mycoplasmataceae bacterium]
MKDKNKVNREPTFWYLVWLFLKISIISFGGGNATFPIVKKYFIDKHNWLTEKELEEIVIITNSIPGASVVETMSYICFKLLKSKWKTYLIIIIALLPHTLLFFTIFILSVSFLPLKYLQIIYVAVIPIIICLLINMTIQYFKKGQQVLSIKWNWLIFIFSFSFSFFVPVPWSVPIFIILFFILILLIINFWKNKIKKQKDKKDKK